MHKFYIKCTRGAKMFTKLNFERQPERLMAITELWVYNTHPKNKNSCPSLQHVNSIYMKRYLHLLKNNLNLYK